MDNSFFERPILNSPYAYPARHWELDAQGQPTGQIIEARRTAQFITPIPRPKKRKGPPGSSGLVFDEGAGVSTAQQQYDPTPIINELRHRVDQWRGIKNPSAWGVTPETARLLQHWRHHEFTGVRPFFCQIEAVETAIWLTEVAPNERQGKGFLEHLANANNDANPELMRLALKLATGAGKTTVMAMLIAWQTVNAVRRPQSKRFTRGFLVVTPGITIKDRLRVLQPNDPDSYYASRELVPGDMLDDVNRAKIVITNYHAFKRRERVELSKGGRALLQGRVGDDLDTLETEGQMLQRVMPELMGLKNILVLNDEAHHCYREKPGDEDEDDDLKGDDRKEAERNNEAARLWISGLEAVNRKLGLARVIDLSATPFFLRGSGYAEGTLFPWTMSDFSLMDAIECGIVKLPRVPVAENIPGGDMPMFRNLWENIRKDMPKKGRGKARGPRPPRPSHPTPDGAPGALRPLREDLQAVGGGADLRAPVLHRRLQQHVDLQARLRLHLRLSPAERGRLDHAGERPPRPLPQLRRAWQPARRAPTPCSSTASSSRAATRSTTTSAAWRPTRSTASAARSSSAPAIAARRRA